MLEHDVDGFLGIEDRRAEGTRAGIDALPRTDATGQVRRFALRDQIVARQTTT